MIVVALVLGHYRTAQVIAVLAIVPDLVWLLQGQLTGILLTPFGSWAFWFLLDLAPVLAMVAFHCLAHAPRARSSRAGTGVWSLTLVLLAAVAGAYRLVSLGNYLQDPRLIYDAQGPHLIRVGLAELLILVAAAALVAPDAARTQTPLPSPPLHPQLG